MLYVRTLPHTADTFKMRHMKSSATCEPTSPSLVSALMEKAETVAVKVRLAEARRRAGLTQPELGDLLDPPVHWRTVQEWESPKNQNIPFRRLHELARIYSVAFYWLLKGEPTPQDEKATDRLLTLGAENALELDALAERVGRIETLLQDVLDRLQSPSSARSDP